MNSQKTPHTSPSWVGHMHSFVGNRPYQYEEIPPHWNHPMGWLIARDSIGQIKAKSGSMHKWSFFAFHHWVVNHNSILKLVCDCLFCRNKHNGVHSIQYFVFEMRCLSEFIPLRASQTYTDISIASPCEFSCYKPWHWLWWSGSLHSINIKLISTYAIAKTTMIRVAVWNQFSMRYWVQTKQKLIYAHDCIYAC